MSEMSPETQAAHREARERLEFAKAAQRKPEAPDEWANRLTRLVASLPVPTDEELAAADAREQERLEREREKAARRLRTEVARAIAELPIKREMVEAIASDSIKPTVALSTVQKWTASFDAKPVLLLLGGVGCGKTVAAAWAVAQQMRRRWGGAEYAKMRDVANLYRAGFGDDLKAFEKLLRAPLLVVDELTTERDVDLGRAALHEVIDERASRDLRTLLLANRKKDEIRDRYDARTIDRLRECAVVVELADQSMRKGAAW